MLRCRALSKYIQPHGHKTRLNFEKHNASKIEGGILTTQGLSKTVRCEEGPDKISCRWIFHVG